MIAQYLQTFISHPTVAAYANAGLAFVISWILLRIFKFVVVVRVKAISKKTRTDIDDVVLEAIDRIAWPFYGILSLFVALQFATVPAIVTKVVYALLLIILTYYVVLGVQDFIEYFYRRAIKKKKKKEGDAASMELLMKVAKWVLWVVALLLVLSNLGYNISTLLAGLGIGGVAIAFALQNILADIFASFTIYFDKPFQLGDFIILGTDMGVVERIGIKSTRIRTLQGEELIVSNRELTETRVRNFHQMQKRRIVFGFGVTYDTPTKKLKKINAIVQKIAKKLDKVELDRVHFKEFAASSLHYEIVYYLNSKEYNVYMDTQQRINLALKEALEKEKIEMAFPTQTVYVKQ